MGDSGSPHGKQSLMLELRRILDWESVVWMKMIYGESSWIWWHICISGSNKEWPTVVNHDTWSGHKGEVVSCELRRVWTHTWSLRCESTLPHGSPACCPAKSTIISGLDSRLKRCFCQFIGYRGWEAEVSVSRSRDQVSPRTSCCDSGAPPGATTPAPVTRSIASATGSSTLIHLQGTCSRGREQPWIGVDIARHRWHRRHGARPTGGAACANWVVKEGQIFECTLRVVNVHRWRLMFNQQSWWPHPVTETSCLLAPLTELLFGTLDLTSELISHFPQKLSPCGKLLNDSHNLCQAKLASSWELHFDHLWAKVNRNIMSLSKEFFDTFQSIRRWE